MASLANTTFLLSPLETIWLNIKMPESYKLETEENYIQYKKDELKEIKHKKQKRKFTFSNDLPKRQRKINSYNENQIASDNFLNKKTSRQHKPNIKEDLGYIDKEIQKAKSNPYRVAVIKECEKAFNQLHENTLFDYFYQSSPGNSSGGSITLSLVLIEKNIKTYKYKTNYEFIMDLRRLWGWYLMNNKDNKDVLAKVKIMSVDSENIFSKMIEPNVSDWSYNEINKKIETMANDLKDIREGNTNTSKLYDTVVPQYPVQKKRAPPSRSIMDKPMQPSEKALLGQNIKQWTKDQKKGILRILEDSIKIGDKKVLEFDWETLSTRKWRELDKYVKSCIKKDKNGAEVIAIQKLKNEWNNDDTKQMYENQKIKTNNTSDSTRNAGNSAWNNNENIKAGETNNRTNAETKPVAVVKESTNVGVNKTNVKSGFINEIDDSISSSSSSLSSL